MGTRNRETVPIDKQEHNADQILTAIDSCLRLEYPDGTPLQQNTFVPWHNRQRCAVRNGKRLASLCSAMLIVYSGMIQRLKQYRQQGEPRLLPPNLNHTVPLNEGIQLPGSPEKRRSGTGEKSITKKIRKPQLLRHNLATVLKRNADRGMFTINLSSGHERTLYAFSRSCLSQLQTSGAGLKTPASDFNVVIYPVSVIGGEESTDRVAPLLCEKMLRNVLPAGTDCIPQITEMMTPSEETTPADETCLKAARAAIDVNNVAFRKFGFAGTPWVLSDTGWHLPTGILQETGTLNLFLKTTDSESGHE